jgi:hypothetical protein
MRFGGITRLVLLALIVASAACHHKTTEPTPVCSITIDPASRTFDSNGGPATVAVNATASSCTWATTTDAAWITISAGTSGTGSGTVEYRVAANTATDSRNGTLKIGDQTHNVTQSGQPPVHCSYALTPSSASIGSDGGTGTFTVATGASCEWSTTSSASWLTVTSGSHGTGNGTITYYADRQDASDARSATIAVAGEVFTLTQDGRGAQPPARMPCRPCSSRRACQPATSARP